MNTYMPKKTASDDNRSFTQPSPLFQEIKKRNFRRLVTLMFSWMLWGLVLLYLRSTFDDCGRSLFALIVVSLFLLWLSFLLFRRYRLGEYPVLELFSSGFLEDYIRYIQLADQALKQKKEGYIYNGAAQVLFFGNVVFKPSFYSFEFFHITEICWVFPCRIERLFFPKTPGVRVYLNNGSKIEIPTESNSSILLRSFRKRAPFAVFGYTISNRECWEYDRKNFIRKVQQRLKTYLKDSPNSLEEPGLYD